MSGNPRPWRFCLSDAINSHVWSLTAKRSKRIDTFAEPSVVALSLVLFFLPSSVVEGPYVASDCPFFLVLPVA